MYTTKFLSIISALMMTGMVWAQTELLVIDTFAGNGTTIANISDNGRLASEVSLSSPYGIAIDDMGTVYISDSGNHRILKIENNLVSIVAGNGVRGDGGDGGPAIEAGLSAPSGLALDAEGNLYIADWSNQKIRRVDSNGIITTIAGTGETGYAGDGGLATVALLSAPYDVAVGSDGNIYLSEHGNDVVRKIDANGIITTIAGTGLRGFNHEDGIGNTLHLNRPAQLAVADNGSVFFADSNNNRVRRIDNDGMVTTIAGRDVEPVAFVRGYTPDGVAAENAILSLPFGLALDNQGGLVIGVWGHKRIRRITPNGLLETLAGNGAIEFAGDRGPANIAGFASMNILALDAQGAIYVADTSNHRVRRIMDGQPPIASFAMNQNEGPAPLAIMLDASNSNDPDGEIASYEWQVPDIFGNPGTASQVELTLDAEGAYNITLIVTDNTGLTDALTRIVYVGEACAGTAAFSPENSVLHLPIIEVKMSAESTDNAGMVAADLMLNEDGSMLNVGDVAETTLPNSAECRATYIADDGMLMVPRVEVSGTPNIPFELQLRQTSDQFMIESVELIE
ncbi:MAG: SMP-30/gluconolactonase/LRE family protein [Pseudomonadota bacterium]